VARRNLERAGVGSLVEIRVGPASESLRAMIRKSVPPFDVIFIDADKAGYVEYLELSMPLARHGTAEDYIAMRQTLSFLMLLWCARPSNASLIPRQSRGLYFVSRSKRLVGVADAAPIVWATSTVAGYSSSFI
jgi:hypothetical protein